MTEQQFEQALATVFRAAIPGLEDMEATHLVRPGRQPAVAPALAKATPAAEPEAMPVPPADDRRPFVERLEDVGARLAKATASPAIGSRPQAPAQLVEDARRLLALARLGRVPLAEAEEALRKAESSQAIAAVHARGPMPFSPRESPDRLEELTKALDDARAANNPCWVAEVERELEAERFRRCVAQPSGVIRLH